MSDLLTIPSRHQALYDEIARSHPSLLAGKVVCARCGKPRTVDAARCLRDGWPKCCGATMRLQEAGKAREKA